MEDSCPIRLRRPVSPRETSPKKGKPSPRGSESIIERSLNDQRIRDNWILQTKHQLEMERQENEKNDLSPMRKRPKRSAIKPKQSIKSKHWDEDGKLIDGKGALNGSRDDQIDFNGSHMNEKSKFIVKEKNLENWSVIDPRLVNGSKSPKSPKSRRAESVGSPQKKKQAFNQDDEFKDFIIRQEVSSKRKVDAYTSWKEKDLHFVNKQSEEILKNSTHQQRNISKEFPKKKQYDFDDQFSYMPDMSLTKNYKVEGLSCQYGEAKHILKQIEINGLRFELENEQYKDCTFKPVIYSDPKYMEKAYSNRKAIKKKKKERKENIIKEATANDEEEMKPRKYESKVPKRTRMINELLSQFKEKPKEKNAKK